MIIDKIKMKITVSIAKHSPLTRELTRTHVQDVSQHGQSLLTLTVGCWHVSSKDWTGIYWPAHPGHGRCVRGWSKAG